MHKIVVAGGRDIDDDALVERLMLELIGDDKDVEIVNGYCPTGVDFSARKAARKHGWKIIPFKADWSKYGKSAGPIRNKRMAIYANEALVIWDGKSSGSGNMLLEAKEHILANKIKEVIYAK